jgi:uncharacterized protein
MSLFEDVNNGIKDAMRQKDQIRLETLRMLKAKILAVDARGNLQDADIIKLFKTYFGNLEEALEQAIKAARAEMAEKLQKEMAIVKEFLPKVPSREETRKIIEEAVKISGAKVKKDFGILMKAVMKINSAVDGRLVQELAAEFLADS